MRTPRALAVIRNRRLNSVALLVPLPSVQFVQAHVMYMYVIFQWSEIHHHCWVQPLVTRLNDWNDFWNRVLVKTCKLKGVENASTRVVDAAHGNFFFHAGSIKMVAQAQACRADDGVPRRQLEAREVRERQVSVRGAWARCFTAVLAECIVVPCPLPFTLLVRFLG